MTGYSPEIGKALKKLFTYYIISGIVFALVMSASIIAKKYAISLYETSDKLQEFNIQYIKIMNATVDTERAIATIKGLLPADAETHLPEELILTALDGLKLTLDDAAITVATKIEDKGNEFLLPVTIKAPIRDYSAFTNRIGYLQSLRFPFFAINDVKISPQIEGNITQTIFQINGALKYPKTGAQPPGSVSTKTGGRT